MPRHLLRTIIFIMGLAPIIWIGFGYLGTSALAAAVTLLIAIVYVTGAVELYRYSQATLSLQRQLQQVDAAQAGLSQWLHDLHPSVRNAVRLRVEGERVALPAPALTPYLVGLLVLLGMLGTLLGMLITLRGTGLALESATDLAAIRGSLAAPVKGLGFAFGTSIAGVAGSAMLGLMSALCRRERLQVVQQLDAQIATDLRPHSRAHQRDEAFRLLQQNSEAMPVLIERLQTMVTAMEQQNRVANEQLARRQQDFHEQTEAVYSRLASSVEQSMQAGVTESTRSVGALLQPALQGTLAALAQEASTMNAAVSSAVQQQLQALASGFQDSAQSTAASWNSALAEQQRMNQEHGRALAQGLQQFNDRFQAGMDALAEQQRTAQAEQQQSDARQREVMAQSLQQLTEHVQASADALAERQHQALALQQQANAQQQQAMDDSLQRIATGFETSSRNSAQQWAAAMSEQRSSGQAREQALDAGLQRFNTRFEQLATGLLDGVSSRLDALMTGAGEGWNQALALHQSGQDAAAARHEQALLAATASLQQNAQALATAMSASHAQLQQVLQSSDEHRLGLWSEQLDTLGEHLGRQWQQAGEQAAQRQQQICAMLEQTAQAIVAQTEAHAGKTIREISALVATASEAPKAAAEVIGELRQSLADSMVRDTAMLDERGRLLATVDTLLSAVNHASTEQRTAVDALVSTSADLLERVGKRFNEQVQAEAGKLGDAAAQVTSGAVEVASLGDAFGVAVELFGQSNQALIDRMEQIAALLDRSVARSDEQLEYYVAQAREVIDLSMLSQKQIIGELQQLSVQQASNSSQVS